MGKVGNGAQVGDWLGKRSLGRLIGLGRGVGGTVEVSYIGKVGNGAWAGDWLGKGSLGKGAGSLGRGGRFLFVEISPINWRNIDDFFLWQQINEKNRRFIASNRYIGDFLVIFTEISPLRYITMIYRVETFRYTIYRRYIPIFSSLDIWDEFFYL